MWHLFTMPISDEIYAIEARLFSANITLARLFSVAGIDRSTWSRWRADKVSPTLGKWRKVLSIVDALVPQNINAPSNPSLGDNGGHAAGSSGHPNPEIPESPPTARVVGDHLMPPASAAR